MPNAFYTAFTIWWS